MGKNTNGKMSNILGFIALALMTVSSVMLLYSNSLRMTEYWESRF